MSHYSVACGQLRPSFYTQGGDGVSPVNRLVVAAGRHPRSPAFPRLYTGSPPFCTSHPQAHAQKGESAGFLPGSGSGGAAVMALVTGDQCLRPLESWSTSPFRVRRAVTVWDVDGTSAAVTGGHGRVRVWDLRTGATRASGCPATPAAGLWRWPSGRWTAPRWRSSEACAPHGCGTCGPARHAGNHFKATPAG
jgi:hypothetical protein